MARSQSPVTEDQAGRRTYCVSECRAFNTRHWAPLFLVTSRPLNRTRAMKTPTSIFAIILIAFTAKGSEPVPYIVMPIDKGYAIDAHGKRQPNALCAHDVIWACPPRYPQRARSSDPTTWSRNFRGEGLYRLDIDLKTGRVSRTTIMRSAGSLILDKASTWV